MKTIGVLCALDVELKSVLELLSDVQNVNILNKTFYEGHFLKNKVVLVKCGIGKVASGISATLLIEHFNPDLIISTGIAGGYDKMLSPLDVVVSTASYYYDFDMRADGLEKIGMMPDNHFPFVSNQTALDILENVDYNLYFGPIMTADQFACNRELLDKIIAENFTDLIPLAVDMETASIMQCAENFGKESISIRAISDVIGNTNQTFDYYNFADRAAHNAAMIVLEIFKKY